MLVSGPTIPVEPIASRARTLGDLLTVRAAHTPDRPAMFFKTKAAAGKDHWEGLTWSEMDYRARQVAHALLDLGLEPGDTVAILGPTQPAWCIYDMGAQLAGMVTVGVYPRQAPEQVAYVLEHSDAKVMFVDGTDELKTTLEAVRNNEKLLGIVPWNELSYRANRDQDARFLSPTQFQKGVLDPDRVEAIQTAITPDHTAILIYTSGTTGRPKGAMISHANILAMLPSIEKVFQLYENDLFLSFLPMGHVTERVLSFYFRIDTGVAAAYATSIGNVLNEVKEVQPTVFGSVPRIFEKAYNKVHNQIESQSLPIRTLFHWAGNLSNKRLKYTLEGYNAPLTLEAGYQLANAVIFKKIHDAFGGRIRMFITGAAPISKEILAFFWGLGLPIYEAYGMTEATVLTHMNPAGAPRLGTVGLPLPGLEQRIAEDGEILLRGKTVFKGYYKNDAATQEAIVDGWLHTGDIGSIDEAGYLRITDRKKHLIITAGGKNVAPASIERAIKNQSPLISHVHAHGDRRPYISALIAPSPIETLEWGAARQIIGNEEKDKLVEELMANPQSRSMALNAAMAKIVANKAFRMVFLEAVKAGNHLLARAERVRRYCVLERDFSLEHGELTPTMKLKRKTVEKLHSVLFEKVYDDPNFAIDVEH